MNRDLYKILETQFPPHQCFNTYVKFQVWVVHNERNIDIQKIKVKILIFISFHTLSGNYLSIFILFLPIERLNIQFEMFYTIPM